MNQYKWLEFDEQHYEVGAEAQFEKDKIIMEKLLEIVEMQRIELENSACELTNVYNNLHNVDHCKEQSILNREMIAKTTELLNQIKAG